MKTFEAASVMLAALVDDGRRDAEPIPAVAAVGAHEAMSVAAAAAVSAGMWKSGTLSDEVPVAAEPHCAEPLLFRRLYTCCGAGREKNNTTDLTAFLSELKRKMMT